MKINEKNLYTFANSKPVDKEGEFNRSQKIFNFDISTFKAIYILKEIKDFTNDGLC